MYTRRNMRWNVIMHFAFWQVIVFFVWAIVGTLLFLWCRGRGLDCSIPISPLGAIGVAVALYIGFKNNQSYDRGWEARKIWRGIVNVSRSWGNLVLSYISDQHADEQVDSLAITEFQRALILSPHRTVVFTSLSAST